jgi:Ca2+-binding RTX toxin-like protein
MQYPANIDLSTLNGENGFQVNGETANDRSGSSVASAGDVNGDGFADVIVGAYQADPTSSGASYVIFGKATGFAADISLASLNGMNGFKLSGVAAFDASGSSIASAGDVNRDGIDDIVVGAFGADPNGTNSGASYVVFGQSSGFDANLNLSSLNGTNGFKLSGVTARDASGAAVNSAGDVNGDGFGDLIVGAGSADPNGSDSGASYVVFGHASGFSANLDLSTLDGANGFKLSGAAAGDRSGDSVAAGDVNGDGFADLIVGAPGVNPTRSGASYVVFGKASGFAANIDLSSLDGSNGFRLKGKVDDYAGVAVASAGDINGDGFADVIISGHGTQNISFYGVTYVVFGKVSGFPADLDLSSLDGTNGFKLTEKVGEVIGTSVASAGDVNGDGFDDIIVGARDANPHGFLSGAAWVVFGKASGFAAALNVGDLDGSNGFQISGEREADAAGRSVSSAGDVNGDGLDDLIVGALGADFAGGLSGASYVVFGRLPDTAVNRTGTEISQKLVGGNFDDVLNGLGGDDTLYGHDGADALDGGMGDDTIKAGRGNDTLDGGEGADRLQGGRGDDTYYVDDRFDKIGEKARSGNDTVFASADYALKGGVQVEMLIADSGAGVKLAANEFDNEVWGGADDDGLQGGDGDDILVGGEGRDAMIGGDGDDVFRWLAVSDSGIGGAERDVIRDFLIGNDTIDLSAIDANSNTAGDDQFSFIGTAVFSFTAGELRQFEAGGNTFLEGDVNGDGQTDFQIGLSGLHALQNSNFNL